MLRTLKNTFKQSVIYGVGNVSMKLAGLVLLPLFTTELSVEQFGVLGLVEVISQLLISLLSVNLHNAYFRWYYDPEHLHRRRELLFSTSFLMTAFSALAGLALVLNAPDVSLLLFNTDGYSYLLIVMVAALFLQILGINPAYQMMLEEKATSYTVTSIFRMLTILLATVWLIVYEDRGLNGIYEGQVIGHALYFLVLIPYLWKRIKIGFPAKVMREMTLYSLPLTLSSVTGVLLSMSDRFILNFITKDLATVGIFSLAFRIANFIKVFLVSSVFLALSPLLMKKMNDPDNLRFYSKIMTYVGLLVAFSALAVSVFGLEVTKLFARRVEYWEAYAVIPVLAFGMYFGALQELALTGLKIAKRSGMIGLSVLIATIVNIGLNFALIPYLSYWGSAIASACSSFVLLGITYYSAQKVYTIPYELRKLFVMLLVAVFLYLLTMSFNGLDIYLRVALKLAVLASYPFILYFLKQFEPVEMERIKAAWHSWRKPSEFRDNLARLFAGKSDGDV